MAIRETARLEREAEETRAQLEQTLGELRVRMSPGQLMDQASDYFRHNSGRAFVGNLRDEVVHNPMPVALIGAGIAWLALSGTMGRRHGNGRGRMERDWGETAATADDLAHGGGRTGATERMRETAEDWVGGARDAMSDTFDSAREMGDRASTAYDEAIGRARDTAEDWTTGAASTAHLAREAVRERAGHVRDRASSMYDQTAGGVRRAARKAADYGRAARHAVQSDGALVNFCREQPLLVAGLGVAVGAALAAMIPSSRAERQVMGETSRDLQDRVRETASETMRAATGDTATAGDTGSDTVGDGRSEHPEAAMAGSERRFGDTWQRESRLGEATRGDSSRTDSWRGETWREPVREAAADVERGVRRGDRASNVESEPQSAPYAESAEAGAMGTTPTEEKKQRT